MVFSALVVLAAALAAATTGAAEVDCFPEVAVELEPDPSEAALRAGVPVTGAEAAEEALAGAVFAVLLLADFSAAAGGGSSHKSLPFRLTSSKSMRMLLCLGVNTFFFGSSSTAAAGLEDVPPFVTAACLAGAAFAPAVAAVVLAVVLAVVVFEATPVLAPVIRTHMGGPQRQTYLMNLCWSVTCTCSAFDP